jgi:hypothetical protein
VFPSSPDDAEGDHHPEAASGGSNRLRTPSTKMKPPTASRTAACAPASASARRYPQVGPGWRRPQDSRALRLYSGTHGRRILAMRADDRVRLAMCPEDS